MGVAVCRAAPPLPPKKRYLAWQCAHEEPATEQSLGCRPIRVCDEDEEVTDMGHVAGENQS